MGFLLFPQTVLGYVVKTVVLKKSRIVLCCLDIPVPIPRKSLLYLCKVFLGINSYNEVFKSKDKNISENFLFFLMVRGLN